MNLLDQKRELQTKLASARVVHQASAHQLLNGGDDAARKRTAAAAAEVEKLEAQMATLDAAIGHADRTAADARAAADEQARTEAIEQRRRSLERAVNSFHASIATAREIDRAVVALGAAHKRWREQLDQGKVLLVPLISRGAAEMLGSIGVRNLVTQIRDRLVAVDLISDSSLTTADLARTVAEEAERIASRWLLEAQSELQRMTISEEETT